MTALQNALYAFWASFGVPAWSQDTVPENAELPYITFEVVSGDALASTITGATLWLRDLVDGTSVNQRRAAVMDRIAEAVPPSGARLDAGKSGYLMLYRNGGNFQRNVQDPEDRKVVGGRTMLEVHFYLM